MVPPVIHDGMGEGRRALYTYGSLARRDVSKRRGIIELGTALDQRKYKVRMDITVQFCVV